LSNILINKKSLKNVNEDLRIFLSKVNIQFIRENGNIKLVNADQKIEFLIF